MAITISEFAQSASNLGLVPAAEITNLLSELPVNASAGDMSALLTTRGLLTEYQSQVLLSGSKQPLVLGDYILLEKIGAGGMGQVLKARHRLMKRVVAIKLLSPSLVQDEAAIKRFEREVEAAAQLTHPNIVQAHDAGRQQGVWYLVMEFVAGRDLTKVGNAHGALPVLQAVDYVLQAATGLAYAHKNGVVHRDIKPANLLLDNHGVVKILDMGLARFSDAERDQDGLTQTGQVMGTVDYMAPEQAFDIKHVDARADIYSLGCTLYRLLTGNKLFAGETTIQKLLAHQSQPVPSLLASRPDVPLELDTVFQRMVAKRPEQRVQTMEEVCALLSGIIVELQSTCSTSVAGTTVAYHRLEHFSVSRPAIGRTAPVAAATEGQATVALTSLSVATDAAFPCSPQAAHKTKILARQSKPASTWRSPSAIGAAFGTSVLLAIVLVFALYQRDNDRPAPVEGPQRAAVKRKQEVANTGLPREPHRWPAAAPTSAVAPFNAVAARQHQDDWADYLNAPVEYENSIGMKFRLVPPGEFVMGSSPQEVECALQHIPDSKHWVEVIKSETPVHKVILTQPFYMGVHEVTQSQYQAIMGTNPSCLAATSSDKQSAARVAGLDTSNHPVDNTNWNEAVEFCIKLSEREGHLPYYDAKNGMAPALQANGYRLPTEAQWEFACRAGTTTRYCTGDAEERLTEVAWFDRNSNNRSHKVGELAPNSFGLSDMHGNVREWVNDRWDQAYYEQFEDISALDPAGSKQGEYRVIRGGDWNYFAYNCRSSNRDANHPGLRFALTGFRTALPIDAVKASIARRR